jgi:hypothetical protein
MGFLNHDGVSYLLSKYLKNQIGAQIDITTVDTYVLSENDGYEYDSELNISMTVFDSCKTPSSQTASITLCDTATGEKFEFGNSDYTNSELHGMVIGSLSMNTKTTLEQIVSQGTGIIREDPNIPAGIILYVKGQAQTMIYLDTKDTSSYNISLTYDTDGVIGLPDNILGDEFENKNGILLSSFGKTKTKQILTNTICSRSLTTPDANMPFPRWIVSGKIEVNIQHGTPYTLSYSKDKMIVEIGKGTLITDEVLDAAFGLGEQNIGYWGTVNTDTTIREVAAGGAWLETDDNMPTIAIIISKNVSSNASYVTFAAPKFYNEDDRFSECELILTLTTEEQETKTITIPNTAIQTDDVPTEGSVNYVNSGNMYSYISGLIGDVNSVISQIDDIVGGV